ncbi:hypothetical protein KW797_03585, partial [Candidatus Parcubacteria bacterium]|nr:hypothetical protein [Candidatus Parcubacteria bacterium]
MDDLTRSHALDRFSFGAIFLLGFLLPLFFFPVAGFPLDAGKGFLVAVLTLVAFALWLLGRLIDGNFSMPKSPVLWGALGLLLSTLVTSLFSGSLSMSFIGQGFEV